MNNKHLHEKINIIFYENIQISLLMNNTCENNSLVWNIIKKIENYNR